MGRPTLCFLIACTLVTRLSRSAETRGFPFSSCKAHGGQCEAKAGDTEGGVAFEKGGVLEDEIIVKDMSSAAPVDFVSGVVEESSMSVSGRCVASRRGEKPPTNQLNTYVR